MNRSPKKAEKIEVRLPGEAKEAFSMRCRSEGRSASEAVRAFIDAHLARSPDGTEPPPVGGKHRRRVATAAIAGALVLALCGTAGFMEAMRGLPGIAPVADLAALSEARGRVEDLPPYVYQAVLSAQDGAFFVHGGYDGRAIARAATADLSPARWAHLQGGATLTQQLAKTVLLRGEPNGLRRKVRELLLARRIERTLSKEQILSAWLGAAYFGGGATGLSQAAQHYFGKSPSDLTVGEAAYLAALPNAPSRLRLDLPANLPRARASRARVLDAMVQRGYLTPRAARASAGEAIS